MSNYSYLCSTNIKAIYPAHSDPNYNSEKQTIACDVYAVPLLWLGLFRAGDFLYAELPIEDGTVSVESPIVASRTAIARLRRAIPYFNRIFRDEGPLDLHTAALIEAIRSAGRKYVTLEMDEVAAVWDKGPRHFYASLRKAFGFIETETTIRAARALLIELANLRLNEGRPFLTIARYSSGDMGHGDDEWNFVRLLGARLHRPVPWERQAKSRKRSK